MAIRGSERGSRGTNYFTVGYWCPVCGLSLSETGRKLQLAAYVRIAEANKGKEMQCRECSARLLGSEEPKGKCRQCSSVKLESAAETARFLTRKDREKPKEQGSVTPEVALPIDDSGSVTKQQRYRAKNADKTRAATAARVAKLRSKRKEV